MRREAQFCLSCLWRWVRVFASYIRVISRTPSHGAHILVPGTWEIVLKVTYNRGGVGASLCPHPWGVTSAAHPSSQPGELCLHSGACLLACGSSGLWQVPYPASVYPPGLRTPEIGPAGASFSVERLLALPSCRLGHAAWSSGPWAAHGPNKRAVELAQPTLAPACFRIWTRVGPPGVHRA